MELEEVREATLRGRVLNIGWGTSLQIHISGMDWSLKSRLIGMEPEGFLIVTVPLIPGILNRLYEGNRVTVRYVYSGVIYGFYSSVLCYTAKPLPIVFLSYPRAVEILNLRKMQRMDCLFPTAAKIEETEYRGVILDISGGGCRFAIEACNERELSTIRVGESVTISFLLPGLAGTQLVHGTVKNIRQDMERAEVGMQFDASNTCVIENIEIYIKNIVELHQIPSL